MLHFGDGCEIERHERLLLRPWLENLIDSRKIPGLEWFDDTRTFFRVPWKHQSRKTWSLGHSSVFLEWAKNTGRWKEGDPEPHYAQLKTRLRCAFSKAPDIEEIKELHCSKAEEPYKVYRFIPKRESKLYPLGRKAIARKSIYSSLKRRVNFPHGTAQEGNAANCDNGPSGSRIKSPVTVRSKESESTSCPPEMDQKNEIFGHDENMTSFDSHATDSSFVMRMPVSRAAPLHPSVSDKYLSLPDVPQMSFRAKTEQTEAHDKFSENRQTILPPVGESYLRSESQHSEMHEPNSLSVTLSETPRSVEASPTKKELDSSLDLSVLPALSSWEKVEAWMLAEATTTPSTGAENKCAEKQTEKSTDVPSLECVRSSTQHKNDTHFPIGQSLTDNSLMMKDNEAGKDSFNFKDKISLGKATTDTHPHGSNVAIATPIFPLKTRYKISKNHLEKEKVNVSREYQHFSSTPQSVDPFLTVHKRKHVPLENGKLVIDERPNDNSASDQDWLPNTMEKKRRLEHLGGDIHYDNQQTFPDQFDKHHQRTFERVDEWKQLQPRTVETRSGNLGMPGVRPDDIWLVSGERQNKIEPIDRDAYWNMTGKRYEENFDLNDNGYAQNNQGFDRVCTRSLMSSCNVRGQSYESCRNLSDGGYQKMLPRDNTPNEACSFSFEDLNASAEPQWSAPHSISAREGPLDLSSRTDFYTSHTVDSRADACRPVSQLHGKVLGFTDYTKMLKGLNRGSHIGEHTKAHGSTMGLEQEHQFKKFGHHSTSMDSSLSHLKAAYKKLLLKTMYVAEKERQLDDFEKTLAAREEAVRLKEEHVKKVLRTLANRPSPTEDRIISDGTATWPPVSRLQNTEISQTQTGQEFPKISTWRELVQSSDHTREAVTETSAVQNYYSMESHDRTANASHFHVSHGRQDIPVKNSLAGSVHYNNHFVEPADVITSCHHPLDESSQPVLPSDNFRIVQSARVYASHQYPAKMEDALSDSARCHRSISGISTHGLSQNQSENFRQMELDVTKTGVSSRMTYYDIRDTSLNSNPVRSVEEPCAQSFRGLLLNPCLIEVPSRDNVFQLKNSFSVAQRAEGAEGGITRILPPVSPDAINVMK